MQPAGFAFADLIIQMLSAKIAGASLPTCAAVSVRFCQVERCDHELTRQPVPTKLWCHVDVIDNKQWFQRPGLKAAV